MLLSHRAIAHQKQSRKSNCVSTCLSIVTGIGEVEVSKELEEDGFNEPFSHLGMIRFLTRRAIHTEKVSQLWSVSLSEGAIYFITCPSSISAGRAHMIVGYVNGGRVVIIDPADDLENEKLYSSSNYSDDLIPCFEYYLLEDCSI